MSARRRFSGNLKTKLVLEALSGDKTLQEIAVRQKIRPNELCARKQRGWRG